MVIGAGVCEGVMLDSLCTEQRRGKVDILGHDSRASAGIHLDHYKQFDYRRKEQLCNVLVLMQGSWGGSSRYRSGTALIGPR